MIPIVGKSTEKMLEKWLEMSNSAGTVEIEVSKWFQTLTEEIITHTAFGSCSYEDGKSIFELQAQQMVLSIDSYSKVLIPGFRYAFVHNNCSVTSSIFENFVRARFDDLNHLLARPFSQTFLG